MILRIVEPEWLDRLTAHDPLAIQSRSDLRRINSLMGNVRLIVGEIARFFEEQPPQHLVELGAGDGIFALRLARKFATRWPEVHLTLVDREPAITPDLQRHFDKIGWKLRVAKADVFEFMQGSPRCDAIFTNLFLHHFEDESLSQLLQQVAAASPRFVACEPRRSRFALGAARCLGAIGCNAVTRHDAVVSVRAGFQGNDLTKLWPSGWDMSEERRGCFSHLFSAQKKGGESWR